MVLLEKVHGSTFQDATHHRGRQAAFKSLLTFRTDTSIPGYTGLIPQSLGIPLSQKNGTEHLGRLPTAAERLAAAAKNHIVHGETMYAVHFPEYPVESYSRRPPARAQQAGKSQPLPAEPLLPGGKFDATAAGPERPSEVSARGTAQPTEQSPTAHIGYRTQYGATIGNKAVLDASLSGQTRAFSTGPRRPPAVTVAHDIQKGTYQLGGPFPQGTTLSHDFVPPAALTPIPGGEKGITHASTTLDLAAGTPRPTHQLPGYDGFVPASSANAKAVGAADGAAARPSYVQQDFLLRGLDQYSRSRVPHYTGHKPQALELYTLEQPAQGPTLLTTQGQANKWTLTAGGKVV